MTERIFVTGGGGFVGARVIDELVRRGFDVNALTHRKPIDSRGGRVRSITGELFDPDALRRGMEECNAVIHLVGIILEHPSKGVTFEKIHHQGTKAVVDAAGASGIRRYVHMSALGTRANAAADYHRTKYLAEQYVRQSALGWTIIRPSMIHGPCGEFMEMEVAWARKQAPPFLFMPYFGAGLLGGGGAGKIQPIYVKDVARAFVDAVGRPETIGKVYEIAGADEVTWPQMHQTVAEVVVGKSRLALPMPAWFAKTLAAVPGLRATLPFNRDQVVMSGENNTADLTPFVADFGWKPQAFRASLESYAAEL